MQPQYNRKLRKMANRNVAYSRNHFCVVFGAEFNDGIRIEIWAQEVPQNRQKTVLHEQEASRMTHIQDGENDGPFGVIINKRDEITRTTYGRCLQRTDNVRMNKL